MAQCEEGTQRLATGTGEPGGNPSQASRPDSPGGNGCRGLRQGVAPDAEEGGLRFARISHVEPQV